MYKFDCVLSRLVFKTIISRELASLKVFALVLLNLKHLNLTLHEKLAAPSLKQRKLDGIKIYEINFQKSLFLPLEFSFVDGFNFVQNNKTFPCRINAIF
jgi:hypothetical protein